MDYPAIGRKELLYIYTLRYHQYSGNKYLDTSFKVIYETDINMRNSLCPRDVKSALDAFNLKEDDYFDNHSVFSFQRLFLKQSSYEQLCEAALYGQKAYARLLQEKNSPTRNSGGRQLCYCPECLKEETSYKVISLHHQIPDVHVCTKHHCYLNRIPLSPGLLTRIEAWPLQKSPVKPAPVLEKISDDVEYIVNHPLQITNEIFHDRVMDAIIDHVIESTRTNNSDLRKYLNEFYDALPMEYRKFGDLSRLELFMLRHHEKNLAPIEYLLFIQMIFGSFQAFSERYLENI